MLDEVTSDTFRDSDFQSVFDLRSETSRQISRFIFFVSIDGSTIVILRQPQRATATSGPLFVTSKTVSLQRRLI